MPSRILKESICTSDEVDKLSAFQETVFYRLIVNCDDYGRMDARPKILASKLFPLKDIRANQMEDALRALSSAELVILYEVDGKPFLQMRTWDRHQQIRAKKSKYPAPDDGIITHDINCKQMLADDSKCPRNPIQSNTNTNPNTNTNAQKRERFDRFWKAYPCKIAKVKAQAAFSKIDPDDELLEVMIRAVEAQKQTEQWLRDGGQYIPYPTTWLNQRRWEDEIRQTGSAGKKVNAQDYEQRTYTEEELAGDDIIIKMLEAKNA
ncbi:MAG: transcriptional regulator [Clostridia bacterium]|nr:transcriptional regulator [Clostridia bacterium]